jgi:hypothetical protein
MSTSKVRQRYKTNALGITQVIYVPLTRILSQQVINITTFASLRIHQNTCKKNTAITMASTNIINKCLHSTTQNGPTIKPPPYLVRVAPRRQYYATTVTALPL